MVEVELRREKSLACKGNSYPTCVNRDPAPPPLFGNIGGCSTAAGWVENQIAGVGGHENAPCDHFRVGLDYVTLLTRVKSPPRIRPQIRDGNDWEIL